jgi:hypothetical protein
MNASIWKRLEAVERRLPARRVDLSTWSYRDLEVLERCFEDAMRRGLSHDEVVRGLPPRHAKLLALLE